MEALIPILFIVGALAVVGIIAYVSHRAAKKRTADLMEAAESMGLVFQTDGDGLLSRFGSFKLFSRGRGQRISNIVSGDAGDVAIAIFDYRYTTGSGKNSTTHNQTVVSFVSPNLMTPDFLVRPQGFFDRVGSALGFQDIDFDTHPEFSNMFVLQGSDEAAIRAFMVPRILELFETKKGICLEADRDTLFFYNARSLAKPDQVKDLLSEAYEFYNCIIGDTGE